MSKKIKLVAYDHHRNGIAGLPFYAVLFQEDGRNMVAILLDKQAAEETGQVCCFALDVDLLARGDVAFGTNSWRGDRYADDLRAAIAKAERSAAQAGKEQP